MSYLQTKYSYIAVTEETTEGTPVAVSTGSEFLPVLEGFSFTPNFENLNNTELRATIARGKKIKGMESPTASFSLYLKSSGTSGVEPQAKNLFEATLGGKSTTNTQYNTIDASSTSVVKVDTGEGASYERGEALLIQHYNTLWEIRNISSISGDDLTLAQILNTAPSGGVNLGKAQLYKGANSGHPSLSLFDYHANDTLQLISGCRPTSMSISANAGEFIQVDFSFDGIKYHYDPIQITTSNNRIDFEDTAEEKNVSIEAKWYKDPYDLASAIQAAMQAGTGDTITVTYSDSTKKYTITSTGSTLSLLWSTGTNSANTIGAKIGFATVSDDTGALTYTSDNAASFAASVTPDFDEADPLVAKSSQVIFGDSSDISCFGAQSVTVEVANELSSVMSMCADSGKSASVITGREVTINVVGYLSAGEAENFKRYRANDEITFTWNVGEKSGGNWVPGKCFNIHVPKCTIGEFSLADDGGIVTLEMTLNAFSDEGEVEFFINAL